MRHILYIYLMLFSTTLLAVDTVRVYLPATDMVVNGTTTSTFTLGSDNPGTDGGITEASAAKVYIPIQTGTNNLFSIINASSLFNTSIGTHTVSFPLLATTAGVAKYIYAAVKLAPSASFLVTAKSTLIAANTNGQINFNLSPLDICKPITVSGNTACSALASGSTTSSTIKPIVYFFLSDSLLADGGTFAIDPATYTGGVYFETQMSNKVFPSSELFTQITRLDSGDGRLVVEFDASTTMDPTLFKKVIIFKYTDPTLIKTGFPTFKAITGLGSLINKDVSTDQRGQFTLNELTNGVDVNIAIAFQDRFLFATTFSDSHIGKPTEIQELLKKQACFLLTAGFGEEHYVIRYFRHYRDSVLAASWFGQNFIKVYYRSAPHYAIMIYKSEPIRFLIRMIAYTLYFFFNFYWVVLIFMASCYYLNKLRKNKIKFDLNRL